MIRRAVWIYWDEVRKREVVVSRGFSPREVKEILKAGQERWAEHGT